MTGPLDSTFLIGIVLFIVVLAVVFGGMAFYRRNVKPGAEDTNPDKFSQ